MATPHLYQADRHHSLQRRSVGNGHTGRASHVEKLLPGQNSRVVHMQGAKPPSL